jgi:hypothetical protein
VNVVRLPWLLVLGISLYASTARAESKAILSLESTATDLKTGRFYDVEIHLQDAEDVWVADVELQYDPALVYVVGTTQGKPVRDGDLFDRESSIVVRNEVSDERILYTLSMLAPAAPVRGSGVVGSFRIYPLAPGTTRIAVGQVALHRAIFKEENGRRVGAGAEPVPVTSVPIELTLTGRPFAPPGDTQTPPR